MKTLTIAPKKNSGSVLLVAVILCAVLGTMLASFLYLTGFQIKSVDRSRTWNSSMTVAEAGMEEGLSMINLYAHTGASLGGWASASTANGWTALGGAYFLQRNLGSNYYQVYITNASSGPTLKSIGYAYVPKTKTYVKRAILVQNEGGSLFLGGVLAKNGINIDGNASFNSFNSQDPNYSTYGQYDPAKHKDGGNIGTIMRDVVAIKDSGSTLIYGQLATGPNSTISMGGNASVGSSTWVDSGKKGIQPNWSRNDLNMDIPDAPPLPSATYVNLPSAGNLTLNAGGGTAYYRATTTYQMHSQNYLLITNGTVYIDAQSGISLNAQAQIIIAPGSQLFLYLGTENTQLDGQGVVNNSGYATNCIVYGKNNCQQIEINGGSAFIGYLYAPYADITLNGNSDFIGAIVGDTFQINGNMGFHYDESLAGPQAASSIYRVVSWKEVSP
jgi:hypothetical protein